MPEDWQLPKSWGEWALTERADLTEADVRREAARFGDYWHAKTGANARKADWEATWRNWIRDAKAPRGSPVAMPRPARSPPTAAQRRSDWGARMAAVVAGATAHSEPPRIIDMGGIDASYAASS